MRTCLPCWKLERGFDLLKADEAHQRLAAETAALQQRAEAMTAKVAALTAEVARLKSAAPPATPALRADLWKTLVFLCHPDRHGGSAVATVATQELIALRPPKT